MAGLLHIVGSSSRRRMAAGRSGKGTVRRALSRRPRCAANATQRWSHSTAVVNAHTASCDVSGGTGLQTRTVRGMTRATANDVPLLRDLSGGKRGNGCRSRESPYTALAVARAPVRLTQERMRTAYERLRSSSARRSGVPTSVQAPVHSSPVTRPCAMARRSRGASGKLPGGQFRNSSGRKIPRPA